MAVVEIVPVGNPEWERIWEKHNSCYPNQDRTVESLKRKFQELVKKKMKTGDPNCPPHVRFAKRIYRKIVDATDGSTGGSDLEDDLEDYGDHDEGDDDGEDGYGEDLFTGVLDVGEGGGEDDDGRGAPHPPQFPPTQIDLEREGEGNTPSITSGDTLSLARMGGSSGAKRLASNSQSGGRVTKKTSKGFSQPLRIPRKWPTSSDKSDDGDGNDGYSFGEYDVDDDDAESVR